MRFSKHTEAETFNRKELVKALSEYLGVRSVYNGMPSRSYTVGPYTIDYDGSIVCEDIRPLRDFLVTNGYIAADSEALPLTGTHPDRSVGTASPAGDVQTIAIPAPDITVEQLRNLTFLLYSRQCILNLMTGKDTIRIPASLIESLKESLPYTREDFTALLDSFRDRGLKGFDFKAGEFTLTYHFYETEPVKWTTFAGLQSRILQAAREAKRVFPELIQPDQEAEKYTAHMWLQRLGYSGPEMKEQRKLLLEPLHGCCAFANREKQQKHMDKYSRIRKEHRAAERAAALADCAGEEVASNV